MEDISSSRGFVRSSTPYGVRSFSERKNENFAKIYLITALFCATVSGIKMFLIAKTPGLLLLKTLTAGVFGASCGMTIIFLGMAFGASLR